MIADYFRGLWKDRYILQNLIRNDLRQKYRKSKLGIAWSILTPLGMVLIIGSVYSILFGTDPKTFIPLLFAGLNPWFFISGSADGGTTSYLFAEGYIKQTTVSTQIFPIRVVTVNFVNLLYSVGAFFIIYAFLQPHLYGPKMLMVIPGLLILYVCMLSVANIVSAINLHIRDYAPLQSLLLQGLFYVTPIIYDPAMLLERGYAFVYHLNPLYYLIEVVRKPMLGEVLPAPRVYIMAISIMIILFVIGLIVTMRTKKNLIYKL